jgi:hypothetical protein
MRLPEAEPGLVVRYDYLWAREAEAGRSSSKERPACLVAASDETRNPRFVVLLPITHSPPAGGSIGIEIPKEVCAHLGLDEGRSWVIVSEYNVDDWPNAGLMTVPGKRAKFAYGFVPPKLFAAIKTRFLALNAGKRVKSVRR